MMMSFLKRKILDKEDGSVLILVLILMTLLSIYIASMGARVTNITMQSKRIVNMNSATVVSVSGRDYYEAYLDKSLKNHRDSGQADTTFEPELKSYIITDNVSFDIKNVIPDTTTGVLRVTFDVDATVNDRTITDTYRIVFPNP